MSTISKSNNSYSLLAGNATFTGLIEKLPLNDISITVALTIDQPVSVVINQYRNSSETSKVSEIIQAVSIGDTGLVQVPIIGLWANISVTNTSPTNMTTTSITTFFQTTNYDNINIRDLTDTRDKINMMGLSPTNTQIQIALDAEGRLITSGGGGGDASQWATFPAVSNVDGDGYDINNVTNISADGYVATDNLQSRSGGITSILVGNTLDMNDKNIIGANTVMTETLTSPNETGLLITSPYLLSLFADNGISISTPPLSGKDPYNMSYSNLGNLSFSLGEQNINNLLGVTHSQGFTLTQNGGGKIIFPDLTEMTTAGGGGTPSTWSEYPATQTVDISGNKITGVTKLDSGEGVSLWLESSPSTNNGTVDIFNNYNLIGSNTAPASEIYLENDRIEINVFPAGYDGTAKSCTLEGTGLLTVPSLAITDNAGINMNGNPINQAPGIQSNLSMVITAGFTDTEEASTLSLSNNGYAVAGNYSELFLRPTGIELTAGNITDNISESATFDTTGLLVVPSIRTTSLDMNQGIIENVAEVAGTDYVALSANSLVTHNGEVDIYTNYTTGGTNDVPASEIWLKNDGVNLYTFPDGYDGATTNLARLGMDGVFTVPKLNISGANSEIAFANGLGFIKGEDLTIGTPTNTSFFLQTNLNVVNGEQYSQILLDTAGIRFITGLYNTGENESYYDNTGLWTFPSVKINSGLDMNGGTITKCNAVKADGDLSISAGQVSTTAQVFITTCESPPDSTPFSQVNLASTQVQIMTADDLDNRHVTTFKQNGDVELYSNLKVGVGGAITFADDTVQTTAYTGGGGTSSTWSEYPATQTVDFSNNKIINVDEVSAGTTDYLSLSANSLVNHTGVVDIYTNWTEGGTNDVPASEFYLNNDGASLYTYPNGYDGAYNQVILGMDGVFSAPSLATDTIKSVTVGQKITLASDINANGASISDVYQMKAYEYYGTPGSGGVINMGGNINLIGHTIYNGLNITSDNLTLREGNGGTITYQDLTTQGSGVQKGTGTLSGALGTTPGSYFISDTRVTAGCICVATYADSPPTGGTLSAIVNAGSGILIQSHLLADTSPIFYMYFI
jgi:hypothetical protein